MWLDNADHPLRRLFAGLTEQTFVATIGIGDPPLIDYLALLLARFLHMDALYRLHTAQGRRLEEVADMMLEAEAFPPEGRTRREIFRHIGDFTLFWTGVYPEMLPRLRSALRKDHVLDYTQQGKRGYRIASSYDAEPYKEEATVLRRLSDEFEICAYGLNQVRREWERMQPGAADATRQRLIH